MWNGHLARQQASSLFHYLAINYAYLDMIDMIEGIGIFCRSL